MLMLPYELRFFIRCLRRNQGQKHKNTYSILVVSIHPHLVFVCSLIEHSKLRSTQLVRVCALTFPLMSNQHETTNCDRFCHVTSMLAKKKTIQGLLSDKFDKICVLLALQLCCGASHSAENAHHLT